MFRFEKLDVWQRAMQWNDLVYTATMEFPKFEQFGLTSQLRKSSISVPSNIAEGSGRTSNKDNARFIEISYGSLMEAVCQCIIAQRQGYLQEETFFMIYNEAQELSRMLSGLRSFLTKNELTQ
jgi:four helix bundle protein